MVNLAFMASQKRMALPNNRPKERTMNVTRIIPVFGVIDALMGLDDACFTLPTFRTLRIEERAKCHFAL
jgi:hypothetical protein